MAAWRPHRQLLNGELDNTRRGKVTGWMSFAGIDEQVTFDLRGDFHRDIRGTRIRLKGAEPTPESEEMRADMEGFARHQTGAVGDITAGLPPHDYGRAPYVEWYSDQNGRVVLELDREQVEVVGKPRPWKKEEPVSREEQARNMGRFLAGIANDLGVPAVIVLETGGEPPAGKQGGTEQQGAAGPTREFLLAAISSNKDPSGRHGHILVARDGETYQAGLLRMKTGAPEVGQVLEAPLRDGRPDFSALSFERAHQVERWPEPVEWPDRPGVKAQETAKAAGQKAEAEVWPEQDQGPQIEH